MSHELHTSYEYESRTIAVFIHIAEQIKMRIYIYESQTVDVGHKLYTSHEYESRTTYRVDEWVTI